MARFNEAPFNVPQFNQAETSSSNLDESAKAKERLKRSSVLQGLLNYFDDADLRVREHRNGIDAQLLNPLASAAEQLRARLAREEAVTSPAACPLNIDNGGVYHKIQIPDTYEFTAAGDGTLLPPQLRVFTPEQRWKIISPYNDLLPVPARVEVAGDPVKCRTLSLLNLDGNGLKQEAILGTLDFPNRLYLKIENFGDRDNRVTVQIEGKTYPTTISLTGQPGTSEIVTLTEETVVPTYRAWHTVDRVTVWNLPKGATLRIAIAPAAFGAQQDPLRPAIHPAYRELEFQRYWSLNGPYLNEAIYLNRFERFETIQSYLCPIKWSAFAVEPNTFGMFGVAGPDLVYIDRRESWPSNLKQTAIYREPLYNLNVGFEETGKAERRVELRPVRNGRSADCYRFRYTVEYPNGASFSIGPNGELIRLTPSTGWRRGEPKPMSILLSDSGSYRFGLDTSSTDGEVFSDVEVYLNPQVDKLWSVDISGLVPEALALVFDRYQRLWVWTGTSMIPLKLSYDNFVFDEESRSVFLTAPYEQVEIS